MQDVTVSELQSHSPPATSHDFELETYSFPTQRLKPMLDNSTKTPLVLVACGSFSPPTHLHTRMFEMAADYVKENTEYEVIGGFLSPVGDAYKKAGLAPAIHRVQMCKLAADYDSPHCLPGSRTSWIAVDPWEALHTEYQPTAIVLDHFDQELNKNGGIDNGQGDKIKIHISLLAGADLIQTMSSPGVWSTDDLEHILGNFGVFIIERADIDVDEAIIALDRWKSNIHVVHQLISNDISSTKIRMQVKRDMSVRYLISDRVIEYINEHGLYRS